MNSAPWISPAQAGCQSLSTVGGTPCPWLLGLAVSARGGLRFISHQLEAWRQSTFRPQLTGAHGGSWRELWPPIYR